MSVTINPTPEHRQELRWEAIESAPYNTEVLVKAGRMTFPAILRPDASMTENEKPCDQWQATTDKHPRCWSDGACWESNAEEIMSAPPTQYAHLALNQEQEQGNG